MTSFYALVAFFFCVLFSHSVEAIYDPTARTNTVVYYGQGPNQQRLLHFCEATTIDIIPLAFLHIFPAQGNGWPGTNFGNQCSGSVYAGPGNSPWLNQLQSNCSYLVADIPVCQNKYGKKIILSLGGSTSYQLNGVADGEAFADLVWGMFGPQNASWVQNGLPRPFDGPNQAVEVDGFDFDIENPSADNQAGYIAMIARLQTLFLSVKKQYLITGAPQCIVPDANMGAMIAAVKFDLIFVQFYNTPYCSARAWVNANPIYPTVAGEAPSQFGYNDWAKFLVGTASANAKLYIGLPGAPSAAGQQNGFLQPSELQNLLSAYFCKPNFGGVMIWEATYSDGSAGGPYHDTAKNILTSVANNPMITCSSSSASLISSSRPSSSIKTSKSSISTSNPTTLMTVKISPSTPSSSRIATSNPTTLMALKISSSTPSSSKISTSKSTSTTTAGIIKQPTGPITPDGSCGGSTGYICRAGYCCSQWGWCGNTALYCGTGCLVNYGTCTTA